MLGPYRRILSMPGALAFSSAGLVARMPMAMSGLAITLMVQGIYGSYALAGTTSAVMVIAYAICTPHIARLVDQHGQARVMAPIATFNVLGMIAMVTCGIFQPPTPVLFFAAAWMGATGGSMGALVRSRWTYLLDSPRDLHTAFSLEASLDEVVFIVGPIVATTLATQVWPPAGVAAAAVIFVIGAFAFLRQRETEPPPVPKPAEARKTVLRNGGLLVIYGIFIFTGAIFGAVDIAVVAFMEEHSQKGLTGLILAVFAAGSGISGILYGARHWLIAEWKRFAIGIVVLAVGVSLFFFVTSVPVLAVVMFFTGMALSPTLVTGNSMIKSLVPAGRLTEGLAWAGTAMNLGVSVGSPIAGIAIDAAGARGGFGVVIAAGILSLITLATMLPILRRSLRQMRPDVVDED